MNLQKKLGPLPVWAWGLILGVGAYILYQRVKTPSSGAGTNPSVLDPNAVDPNTGLTYGQEEQAGLSGLGTPAGGTSPGQSNLTTGTNELGDLESFLTEFKNVAELLNPGGGTSYLPPVINISIPPTTPTAHTPVTGHAVLSAPSGSHKPADKPGFTTVGIGGGKWVYVPSGSNKPTGAPKGFTFKGTGHGGWTLVRTPAPPRKPSAVHKPKPDKPAKKPAKTGGWK